MKDYSASLDAWRLLFAGMALVFLSRCDPGCSNTVLSASVSPDKLHRAIIFQRDCGATTAFSVQVSVLAIKERVRGGGNTFVADAGRPAEKIPDVRLRWLANNVLQIRYAPHLLRIFKQRRKLGTVTVIYESS